MNKKVHDLDVQKHIGIGRTRPRGQPYKIASAFFKQDDYIRSDTSESDTSDSDRRISRVNEKLINEEKESPLTHILKQ